MMTNLLKLSPIGNAAEELFALQKEQLEHDSIYHKDICSLSVQQRMNHYALHFAKYAGYFVEALHSEDQEKFNKAAVDSFIIALSTANTLNVDLGSSLPELAKKRCLKEFETKSHSSKTKPSFIFSFVEIVGKLSKACESVDHLESYPFRKEMIKCIQEILLATLNQGPILKINLPDEARNRLASVKERNIFHNR
ncbi:hypothetical protein NBZ79_00515 [Sneathiella marina]|uniref:HEPN domain-containing protein n=1 Tax=Sneathiella marina TaxID=2950108 RepID=A0ABY4W6C0_9PROT|nr:hypothetical protein [Sneathiella marina]USG61457.1 hypothetical protein NBZ79_00515 [Sneathiella marina]